MVFGKRKSSKYAVGGIYKLRIADFGLRIGDCEGGCP